MKKSIKGLEFAMEDTFDLSKKKSEINQTDIAANEYDEIENSIKRKKKRLGVMWLIIYTILFIGFFEVIYNAIQLIYHDRDCGFLMGIPLLDGLLNYIADFIGIVLWSWPIIYIYWLKDYIVHIRLRSHATLYEDESDEDYDAIDPLIRR